MKKRIKKLELRLEEKEKEHYRKIKMMQKDFYNKTGSFGGGGGQFNGKRPFERNNDSRGGFRGNNSHFDR